MRLPWRQPEPEPEPEADEADVNAHGFANRLIEGPWIDLAPATQITVPAEYWLADWTLTLNAAVAAEVGYSRLVLHTEGRN